MGSHTVTALGKLWELVKVGVGPLLTKYMAERQAAGFALRLPIEAEAAMDTADMMAERGYELKDGLSLPSMPAAVFVRAAQEQQIRQINNVASIVEKTIPLLTEGETATRDQAAENKSVDPDFATQFFDGARTVSSEEMQALWAKVLAREVVAPNSISSRALAAIRVLSRTEAKNFSQLLGVTLDHSFVLASNDLRIREPHRITLPTRSANLDDYYARIGLSFGVLKTLEVAGLLIRENDLIRNVSISSSRSLIGLIEEENGARRRRHRFYVDDPSKTEIAYPAYPLTTAGIEIALALRVPPREDFIPILRDLYEQIARRETVELGPSEPTDAQPGASNTKPTD